MDFEVNGINYRAGKLNCFQQLTVVRKLAPLLKGVGGIDLDSFGVANAAQQIGPLLDTLAELPEADVRLIIKTCLGVVSRQSGDRFVVVQTQSGELMFDDLGMTEVILICFNVIKANMTGFFAGLPSNMTAALTKMGDQFKETTGLS